MRAGVLREVCAPMIACNAHARRVRVLRKCPGKACVGGRRKCPCVGWRPCVAPPRLGCPIVGPDPCERLAPTRTTISTTGWPCAPGVLGRVCSGPCGAPARRLPRFLDCEYEHRRVHALGDDGTGPCGAWGAARAAGAHTHTHGRPRACMGPRPTRTAAWLMAAPRSLPMPPRRLSWWTPPGRADGDALDGRGFG